MVFAYVEIITLSYESKISSVTKWFKITFTFLDFNFFQQIIFKILGSNKDSLALIVREILELFKISRLTSSKSKFI
ncbi:MAG: hypothetical protein CXT78_07175 [Thaumarchaeota archaeon]|nr:MAG: hypothetical protein CXT78_07175 [Nitrososphaerota archaeon]